ncbi:MAG: hypothetical protein GY869_24595, partial [Planctomycetes bacterium]|nr:hypothetical protein [Planctomycetota bacterium]
MITNSVFNHNLTESYGGGVCTFYMVSTTMTNCILSNNYGYYGGAICNMEDTLNMIHCTLAGNQAFYGKSLLCDSVYHYYPSQITITNSILANGGDEIWNEDGSTVSVTYSDVQGGLLGRGNIDADPLFKDAAAGDLHILNNSIAMDTGTSATAPLTDADGLPRPVDFAQNGSKIIAISDLNTPLGYLGLQLHDPGMIDG